MCQKIGSVKNFGMADVGGNFHVSGLGKLQAPENTQEITCARLWHRYFPVNFAKFLRSPFLQSTSGRLLLLGDSRPIKFWQWLKIYVEIKTIL